MVQNVSGQAMASLKAVVVFYGAEDTQLYTESGSVQFSPLLAGQRSSWSVDARYDPASTRWSVEFHDTGGAVLTRFGSSVP
jgi:hypothetical protein